MFGLSLSDTRFTTYFTFTHPRYWSQIQLCSLQFRRYLVFRFLWHEWMSQESQNFIIISSWVYLIVKKICKEFSEYWNYWMGSFRTLWHTFIKFLSCRFHPSQPTAWGENITSLAEVTNWKNSNDVFQTTTTSVDCNEEHNEEPGDPQTAWPSLCLTSFCCWTAALHKEWKIQSPINTRRQHAYKYTHTHPRSHRAKCL